jgi:hypothetical protein
MLNANYVSDNTGNLSSLFDGSVTNESSAATMPSSTTEPTSGVDDAADNQQDWDEFDGDINDFLSSRPPTYLQQSKRKKSSCSSVATKYEYHYCRCGCAYKLSIYITGDESSGMEQIHYKEVMVSCNCYVTLFATYLLYYDCYNVLCTSFIF